ncbi:IS66 family transposase [Desulfogranum mediterraneum]|uniref:IS66 family transposase n=1 Tax=Desulfogranum mediterraneum TaxID=160661 RepID=UPI00041E0CB4|nr:IS66 family transposase [Desulfogranum mediterraneum]
MKISAETLAALPAEARVIIEELQQAHAKETGLLREQIRLLQAKLFGPKSEKRPVDSEIEQLLLFDLPEAGEDQEPEEKTEVKGHSRKKAGRRPLPVDLPRVEVVHDLDEADKICGCGCRLSRIGEEVSEQLDVIPARIQVVRNIRPKYACKQCDGVKDDGPTVKIAPVPPAILPKSLATAGLLAFILISKFVDHLPFYRQEKQFARLGVDLSRTLMSNWTIKAAEACIPLLNLLEEEVLEGNCINIDETPVQVLKESGRDPTTKSYMWVFRRGDPEKTILIYQYHPTRGSRVPKEFLGNYAGCVQTDGYAGYDFLDAKPEVLHLGCLAHARRKFDDIIKAQGKKRKTGSADIGLAYIRKLYQLEREYKKAKLTPEEIYRARQEQAKPVLDNFKEWLDTKVLQTPPKNLLGKAVTYCLNQWPRLIAYLEDGSLKPDNNLVENAIRPFAVGRKNWLFAGNPKGAEASAAIYSLIETAKANGIEPYSYLRHIFEALPVAQSLEDYEAMLPWNVKLKSN